MMQTMLHVIFTPSGAGSLNQALRNAGRDDQVVSFFDDLSFGPINPADSSLRAKWVENELGWTEWDDVTAQSERFWRDALFLRLSRGRVAVAAICDGICRLSGMALAAGRCTLRSGRPDDLRISIRPPQPPVLAVSVAALSPDQIRGNNLWDLAEPLQMRARDRYLDLWRQLRSENAPLRVIDGEKLLSAPITFFDSLLLSYAKPNWQKVAMVVGRTLASQVDESVFQTGDIFLAPRINALVESGRLEIKGKSALEMRFSEVRLPRARA